MPKATDIKMVKQTLSPKWSIYCKDSMFRNYEHMKVVLKSNSLSMQSLKKIM